MQCVQAAKGRHRGSAPSLSAWMTSCPHGSCLGQDHIFPISSWSTSSGVYSADICPVKTVKFSASQSVFLLSSSPWAVKTVSHFPLPNSHIKFFVIQAGKWAFRRKLAASRSNRPTERLKRSLAVNVLLTDVFFIFRFSTGRSHWGGDFDL